MTSEERIIREYLSKRDPRGYYIIPATKGCEELLTNISGIELEEAGNTVFIKTKSRSTAEKILRILIKRNYLHSQHDNTSIS